MLKAGTNYWWSKRWIWVSCKKGLEKFGGSASINESKNSKPALFSCVNWQDTVQTKLSALKGLLIMISLLLMWYKPSPCTSQKNIIRVQRSFDGEETKVTDDVPERTTENRGFDWSEIRPEGLSKCDRANLIVARGLSVPYFSSLFNQAVTVQTSPTIPTLIIVAIPLFTAIRPGFMNVFPVGARNSSAQYNQWNEVFLRTLC